MINFTDEEAKVWCKFLDMTNKSYLPEFLARDCKLESFVRLDHEDDIEFAISISPSEVEFTGEDPFEGGIAQILDLTIIMKNQPADGDIGDQYKSHLEDVLYQEFSLFFGGGPVGIVTTEIEHDGETKTIMVPIPCRTDNDPDRT